MNGAYKETRGSGFGPSGEDLDAVLGRFQTWAATRRTKGENASEGVRLPREAREVSYEEALQASSYIRPMGFTSLDPLVPEVNAHESAAEEPKLQGSDFPPVSLPPISALVVEIPIAPVPATRARAFRSSEIHESSPVATTHAKPAGSVKGRRQRPRGAFRDVLQSTAALVAAAQPGPAPLERGKSTSLTLRVSDSEQARIQARAVQANLSVSAYLRQCALGVDELREQVELALKNLHQQQEHVAPSPGISAIPGILGRFAIQSLRRVRGTFQDSTVISIR